MLVLVLTVVSSVSAAKPTSVENGVEAAWEHTNCATIQDGTILDSANNPLEMGYDQFGYNYQAHMFNGTYDSVDRVLDGKYYGSTGDYVDDTLMMKWSDEWIANVDCDGDHKLDRGLGTPGYDGIPGTIDTSRGWTTNHVVGEYIVDGISQHYTYFIKIGWTGVGSPLWGQYSILQEEYQDPTGMMHEKYATPGLGLNDHWTE